MRSLRVSHDFHPPDHSASTIFTFFRSAPCPDHEHLFVGSQHHLPHQKLCQQVHFRCVVLRMRTRTTRTAYIFHLRQCACAPFIPAAIHSLLVHMPSLSARRSFHPFQSFLPVVSRVVLQSPLRSQAFRTLGTIFRCFPCCPSKSVVYSRFLHIMRICSHDISSFHRLFRCAHLALCSGCSYWLFSVSRCAPCFHCAL